jgi:hypothetical protein
MLSDQTEIFTILPSQTSAVTSAPPATTNTAFQTYKGCGLPPIPDYTYTGYQPPCTATTNGVVQTIYPIVPVTDSSLFFGTSYLNTIPASPSSTSTPTSQASINTSISTGVLAQELQCPTPFTPSPVTINHGGPTSILSVVSCALSGASASVATAGICHTSGYTTFSFTGTTSYCCPTQWDTSLLGSTEMYCVTTVPSGVQRRATETFDNLIFTTAGLVTGGKAVLTSSSSSLIDTMSASSITGPASETAKTATPSPTQNNGPRLNLGGWRLNIIAIVLTLLALL